jgi:hypothetical protein
MSRVLFGGKALREPTAAATLRIGVQPTVNPNATNRVAVMGSAEGGVPQSVYTFSSFAEARSVLRNGDSLKAISYIFNPSPSFGGAAQVDFIRLDQATQASREFGTAFSVTSVDSGYWTNGILVQVAASGANRTVTIKAPSPTIQEGTDGVATLSGNRFSAPTAKFISKGAKTGDLIVIRNGDATTITVYTIATIVDETEVTVNETVSAGTSLIWWHAAVARTQVSPALTAVAGTENINANIVAWINDNAGDLVTAALLDPAAALVTATTGNTSLQGGTTAAWNNTQITSALTLLADREVNHLYVARACGTGAGELDFAGLLTGHILNQADIPALAYIGAEVDKPVVDAIAYAGVLNSARLIYTFQTALDSSLDGLGVEEIPGYLLAAKVAGLAAGLQAQTPLTRKPLSVLGLKALPSGRVLDKATRESLLKAGILHLFQPVGTNTFVINQGVTTLQNNNELWDAATASSSEISLMRIVDSVLTDLRQSAAATFIGATSTTAKPVVQHFVQSYLESQVGGLLQGYSGVTITQVQDRWFVEFGMVPAYPINFVLITGTVIA